MSRYRMLAAHVVGGTNGGRFIPAGAVVTTGAELPVGWSPTGDAEPLDAPAVTDFYAASPQLPRAGGNAMAGVVTCWQSVGGGFWKLTGLGSALAAVPQGIRI